MCCRPAGQLAGLPIGGTLICTLTVQGLSVFVHACVQAV